MATDSVLFVGWNRPIAGREKLCGELFQTALKYYGKLKETGAIESFEPIILGVHGGDLNGFTLLRGSAEQLFKVRQSDEFQELLTQINMNVTGVGAINGWTGEGVAKTMQRYMKFAK
jgi:hypothetical protein